MLYDVHKRLLAVYC